jgi:hypothetical protein
MAMGADMDVCFGVTALKTGGINATLACPPFSVFCAVDFSAVGIEQTPNTCVPFVNFTINDCAYNITAFMSDRCLGEASCQFESAYDLYASGFLSHACASYYIAPIITLDFYGQCCTTVLEFIEDPVFVGSPNTAGNTTAATAACPAQIRLAPSSPAATSQISLVVELPGQWALMTVSLHVVAYLSPTRPALYQVSLPEVFLEFSAEGAPYLLANYPSGISMQNTVPALRFEGRCPVLYDHELPRQPSADYYAVFSSIVDAPPNAIRFVFVNVLSDEFFYLSDAVVVDSAGTTGVLFPPAGTRLEVKNATCAACSGMRTVGSEILVDNGQPLLR